MKYIGLRLLFNLRSFKIYDHIMMYYNIYPGSVKSLGEDVK